MEQPIVQESGVPGLAGTRLTLEAFSSMCGSLAGIPFVKVVVDRRNRHNPVTHFINHHRYRFHSDYIAEQLLGKQAADLDPILDDFNDQVYHNPDRDYLLGTLALHRKGERFFTLETVEVDTMDLATLCQLYDCTHSQLDHRLPLLLKPANHQQEQAVWQLDSNRYPVVSAHELYASSDYVALNPGSTQGRLRVFRNEAEYRASRGSLEWYDIVIMERVPDDIPRLSGIINAAHTTPLSHTNVLASGWGIPNAVQLGAIELGEPLDEEWVRYEVDREASGILLERTETPAEPPKRPSWALHRIILEEPEVHDVPIADLAELRATDNYRYGTKAANLGELIHLFDHGSERLLGFYRLPRPPRENLLPHLARFLGLPEKTDCATLGEEAVKFLRSEFRVPRGIALPFALQQEFLESSPTIQQTLGKLKMALELGAREVDSFCLRLQTLVRKTRMSDAMRARIDAELAEHMLGVSAFVVRSSSNAEDLDGFSAAGIYESITHVTTAEKIFQSIKEVWASLLSPRSTRLRHEVGISLDDSYMGVIIQEQMASQMGGVLVTTNPTSPGDFRNVYVNVSPSAMDVVEGTELPHQYLYNTVEGGGRTLALGTSGLDLDPLKKEQLGRLAYGGRLLQSHFSPDYTFSCPADIEWVAADGVFSVLQLRPYVK